MTDEPKETKQEPTPTTPQRLVVFEIKADGVKLLRNDCISIIEFQGLLIAAQEFLRKK